VSADDAIDHKEEIAVTTSADTVAVSHPITAGPEMAVVHRFFRACTWNGTIVEGGMGPGSSEMTAEGRGVHTTIQDGRWIVGDYEQEQYLPDGTLRPQVEAALGCGLGSRRRRIPGNPRRQLRPRGRDARTAQERRPHVRDDGPRPLRQRMIWNLRD
jgi:hypothetical protein